MPIKISSFMGPLGFTLRKRLPKLSSSAYLLSQSILRKNESAKYIDRMLVKEEKGQIYPLYIAIETINRCNGECAFCPANIHSETRPFAKMTDELFDKILDEVASWGDWKGVFSLYVNNEPFIDVRMKEMLKKSREKLPHAQMLVFSNGSLLTPEIMDVIAENVDVMYINNYSLEYKLNDNIAKIYEYVKQNESKFEKVKIVIQKRYQQEVLTSRAGNSPNKKEAVKGIKEPCLIPYTDLTIYPNGQVGLCCSDVLETQDFGNCNEKSLLEIFNCKELQDIRKKMAKDRSSIPICAKCDFIDSGIRLNMMKGNP
ncbi:MAG: SPASM domain-containing protein [Lachnospiraceae bacterium]|nr:SPASM domain-containing protein [Lachnospiraceae bacterium]